MSNSRTISPIENRDSEFYEKSSSEEEDKQANLMFGSQASFTEKKRSESQTVIRVAQSSTEETGEGKRKIARKVLKKTTLSKRRLDLSKIQRLYPRNIISKSKLIEVRKQSPEGSLLKYSTP